MSAQSRRSNQQVQRLGRLSLWTQRLAAGPAQSVTVWHLEMPEGLCGRCRRPPPRFSVTQMMAHFKPRPRHPLRMQDFADTDQSGAGKTEETGSLSLPAFQTPTSMRQQRADRHVTRRRSAQVTRSATESASASITTRAAPLRGRPRAFFNPRNGEARRANAFPQGMARTIAARTCGSGLLSK